MELWNTDYLISDLGYLFSEELFDLIPHDFEMKNRISW